MDNEAGVKCKIIPAFFLILDFLEVHKNRFFKEKFPGVSGMNGRGGNGGKILFNWSGKFEC